MSPHGQKLCRHIVAAPDEAVDVQWDQVFLARSLVCHCSLLYWVLYWVLYWECGRRHAGPASADRPVGERDCPAKALNRLRLKLLLYSNRRIALQCEYIYHSYC